MSIIGLLMDFMSVIILINALPMLIVRMLAFPLNKFPLLERYHQNTVLGAIGMHG